MSETPYVETEILLCILRGDDEAAERHARTLIDSELSGAVRASSRMVHMLRRVRDDGRRGAGSELPQAVTDQVDIPTGGD